ncbi:hypothetical protein [uncultured Tateyamaria sp.]|uniref:hypothetical protein n=1 Tax=uncultured Tateyamaria sp. TaxID=455651 RepID=UPI00262E8767|nr:hypothetical protein [uncultured Tateyamaria sp.]
MKPPRFLLVVVLGLAPCPAIAERNLIPTMDGVSNICPDRPEEPQWMQEIALRDAYQRVLVQDIYRAQSLARVVETGDCACQTLFPPWDAAVADFNEQFTTSERWEMLDASSAYGREANALRPQAMAICEAVGNW